MSELPTNSSDEQRAIPVALPVALPATMSGSQTLDERLAALLKRIEQLPGVRAAQLFLVAADASSTTEWRRVATDTEVEIPKPEVLSSTSGNSFSAIPAEPSRVHWYTEIVSDSKHFGWLGVECAYEQYVESTDARTELLSTVTGLIEQESLRSQVNHFSRKIEVLNELNKLIASGVNLERIMRTLAREVAFRFSADCSMALYLPDESDALELRGNYGIPPRSLPTSLPIHGTQLGRVLRLGGILSVPNFSEQRDFGLGFLQAFGMTCAHVASIHLRGELLGALVLAYRGSRELDQFESDMLEEFSRGAAVAIANAKSQITLTKYTEKLEELVEERTADLAVQTARADQANKAKSQFVANMSHELRTPLTAIVGYSSVLAEGVFGDINAQQSDALKAICKAADHLKELINDVLDVAKVEAGKDDPEPAEVEVYPLLEQVYKLMMQTAMGKGVKLVPIKSPDDETQAALRCWVDPRHIRQILINIMSNAVKYTPTGGTVTLAVSTVGDKAKITVSDTGVGIAKAEIDKVFERFNRADDSYSQAQVGTGIGLSLTKHLVEMNGGKIGLESEVGKGSDFWILMPLSGDSAKSPTKADAPLKNEVLSRLDGLNILIVDDNQLTCEVLKTIIASVGGNSYIANTVPEAREIISTTALDTALIDLALPGENGIVLLDYLRNQCEAPLSNMPLIVVSACVFDQDRREALDHGASTFIAKPFSPAEIVNKIRELTTSSILNSF